MKRLSITEFSVIFYLDKNCPHKNLVNKEHRAVFSSQWAIKCTQKSALKLAPKMSYFLNPSQLLSLIVVHQLETAMSTMQGAVKS